MGLWWALAWLVPATTAVAADEPTSSGTWYRGLLGRTATDLDSPARYQDNKEVDLLLRVDGTRVGGHYFYFAVSGGNRGGDIPLRGARGRQGEVRLAETGEAGRATGNWVGRVEGNVFSGTWTDPAGRRRLKFFLRELPNLDGEEHLVAPGVAYRPRRVIGTNLALPLLTRHPDAGVLERVNGQIQAGFEGSRCNPDQEFPAWPDDYGVDWKVTFASRDLLSVEVSEEWFCGAAYPSTEDRSFTFDLRTGSPVGFEDLFRDFAKDGEAILDTLFGEAIRKLDDECRDAKATFLHPAAADPPTGVRLLSGRFAFHLTETALVAVESDLVHAIRACGVTASVPYEKLRRFASPDGPIARILGQGTAPRR